MKRFSLALIFLTLTICLGYTVQNRWESYNGNSWKTTISSDGYGYYAYLPCIFIYHGFDYKRALKEEQKICPDASNGTLIVFQNKVIDKYFAGVALLLVPFFLLAYLLSYLLGYGTGGYEFPFQASVSIGALFYLAIGLIFLRKLLREFGISDFIAGLILILVVFGTNLFYYATMSPSMSHVYSFGLTAVFLFFTKKSIEDFRLKNLIWMAVTISVLTIIRPTNLLSLIFIPFLAGSLKNTSCFIDKLFKSKKTLIILFIAAGIIFLQLLLWFIQTGHFFVWSYNGEGFNFSKPHFIDILFSYQNGWFLYTPLMFIAFLGGLVTLCRQNTFRFFNALFFFLLVTYVLSSWWAWWYGGAFGLRAFIDFYPAFALLLAFFLNSIPSLWVKIPVIFITFLCVGLNLFQIYQFTHFILPYDVMNKERYWKIFLKSSNLYCGVFDYPDTTRYKYIDTLTFKNDFENNTLNDKTPTSPIAHTPSHPVLLYSENQNSPEFMMQGSRLKSIKNIAVYVKLWAFMTDLDNDAMVLVNVKDKRGNITLWSWKSLQGFVFEKNRWAQAYFIFQLPEMKPDDTIRVLAVNTKNSVYIDDMEVKFCTPLK